MLSACPVVLRWLDFDMKGGFTKLIIPFFPSTASRVTRDHCDFWSPGSPNCTGVHVARGRMHRRDLEPDEHKTSDLSPAADVRPRHRVAADNIAAWRFCRVWDLSQRLK